MQLIRRSTARWILCAAFALPLIVSAQTRSGVDDELISAARRGDVARAATLLDQGANPDAKTEYGITPIQFAADNANFQMVKLLIEHGADAAARDLEYGKDALYLVTYSGKDKIKRQDREKIVALLLDQGVNGGVSLVNLIKEEYFNAALRLVRRGEIDPVYLNRALPAARAARQTALLDALVKAGANEPGPADSARSPERLNLLAGVYRNAAGQELTLAFNGDELLIERQGDRRVALIPALYEVNLFRTFDEKVVVTLNPGAMPPRTLTVTSAGRADTYTRSAAAKSSTSRAAASPATASAVPKAGPSAHSPAAASPASREWPAFRGFRGSGVAAGARAPLNWDAEKGVNIKWRTPIPGLAHSSPIVWGDRVFVTTSVPMSGSEATFLHAAEANDAGSSRQARDDMQSWRVYALDRRSGKIVWQRVASEGVPRTQRHVMQSQANPTPATDGSHLVAWFGSEGLYCYDMDGALVWKHDLGPIATGMYQYPDYEWNTAASPIIYKNLVIVQADMLDPRQSFIAAFDIATGKEVWRTHRDERASWTTPIVFEDATHVELVTAAGDFARGYDPETGRELWRFAKHSIFSTPMPVAGDGLFFITSGGGVTVQPIYAVRPGAKGDITLDDGVDTNPSIVWSMRRGGPYIPTPIYYNGILYVCSNNGILAAYQADTGNKLYQERLSRGGNYTASAVAADGKLYYANEEGVVIVVRAGPRFELLAENPIGSVVMATPAVAGDMLIFRTLHEVVAVAEGGVR